ncbi:hypothetical protein Tco_0942570 [Tanacetum coccineum]
MGEAATQGGVSDRACWERVADVEVGRAAVMRAPEGLGLMVGDAEGEVIEAISHQDFSRSPLLVIEGCDPLRISPEGFERRPLES